VPRPRAGYDVVMTESENEPGTTQDGPEQGLISDEELPDDLRPDKNPMAAEPDDDPDAEVDPTAAGAGGDPGQPG
jgi:hypothetical protein